MNNSVYLTYLEETRIAYMNTHKTGSLFDTERGTIMARSEINYRYPATLGDIIVIAMSVAEVRNSSFEFHYRLTRQSDQRLIAEAKTVMVCFNYRLNMPVRLPEEWRKQLSAEQLAV